MQIHGKPGRQRRRKRNGRGIKGKGREEEKKRGRTEREEVEREKMERRTTRGCMIISSRWYRLHARVNILPQEMSSSSSSSDVVKYSVVAFDAPFSIFNFSGLLSFFLPLKTDGSDV